MTQTADIIIIGGGVMGASIAYALTNQRGGRVVLLERRALSTGTTGHSGAIIRQHYSNDVTIQMAQESLHVFEQFDEIVGGECGFVRTGLLVLSGQQDVDALQANVKRQQRLGVNTKIIHSSDIDEIAPGYSYGDASIACYEADTGVADPVATTYSYANCAKEQGAIIEEGATATKLLVAHERVIGVETTQGTILASQVIIAANVWSAPLVQPLGLTLPVKATRHPMLVLRRPPEKNGRNHNHAVCFDEIQHIYLRPDNQNVTLIGSLVNVEEESNPDNYMQGVMQDEVNAFRFAGEKRLPVLKQAVMRGGWAGIYDDSPDHHPILGRLSAYDGLFCAVGFSGHGFKMSPCIGRWMAHLVLTGEVPAGMEQFAFERFAQGREIHSGLSSGVLG